MKAIVTTAFGNPPKTTIENRAKPTPREGYSLVRIHTATINQLSKYIRQGNIPGLNAPLVLGNEGAGSIEESARFAPGTRVGIYGGNKLGITEDGLFQEWTLVEDARLFQLPDTLNWDAGATLSVNFLTAYRALTKAADVKAGQSILVAGATGSVGNALVQLGKALGARVIALASSADKVTRARDSGAHDVIDLSQEHDVASAVRGLTDGQGADWAFDPVGGTVLNQLLYSVRFRGSVVSLGFAGGMEPAFDALEIIAREKRIVGYSLHAETDEDVSCALAELVTLAAAGKIRPLIDSTVTIDGFEEGYARLASRKAIGSIVLHLQDNATEAR
ncbi:Zinc-binding alcohol dehydrogenase family protein [Paraburkholderia sacchari]|uniref:quinone oxidoreductase family protein n=1 Tax=Paraburkholderia sacchari TaxID=159450 RepID=UPI0039A5B82E